ncbi:hypothetical protein ACFWBX_33525 [Streptomyces sp. NPDC059991]|uniref:hypothetical protein n=1 Tax=Streptomyces sp. NPDC059991 TaxID=3347028 RepID=UPI0036ABA136
MSGMENYKYGPMAKESRSGRRKSPGAQVLKWVTRCGRDIRASTAVQLFGMRLHP